MEQYDICISSTIQDRAIAQLLAQKLGAYRLPRDVRIPEGRDYRRILLDTDEKPFDDEVREMLGRPFAISLKGHTPHAKVRGHVPQNGVL